MKTLAEIELAPQDRDSIEAAVVLLNGAFPVQRVVLFGSKAKGTADEESDIDLLVLTTRPLTWRERDALTDALFDIELAHDVVISTLVAPADEWETGYWQVLPIHEDIERHGVAA